MSHLTYTVRIPPERENAAEQAILAHMLAYPQDTVDDAIDKIFAVGAILHYASIAVNITMQIPAKLPADAQDNHP